MKKWKKSPITDDSEALPHNGKCAAHGCPLPGSVSHTTAGKVPNNGWVCRVHFFADAIDWPKVTENILNPQPAKPRYTPGADA